MRKGAKDILDQRWDFMWRKLARHFVVDEEGSAEYRRKHAEWVAAGRPPEKIGWYAYPEKPKWLPERSDGDASN